MSSPGQKKGSCGHAMAGFDGHSFCARCREKGKGEEPCITNKDTTECKFCNLFSPEQWAQLATPSYKLKKEKRDAKRVDNPTPMDIVLVDPASISVIGAVGGAASSQSPSVPPEKKTKKDKSPSTKSKKSASSSTDDRFSELDAKWSERFNRLKTLLMARSLEPSFSADVRVPLYTHHQPLSLRTQSLSFSRLTNLWTLLLSALAQTLMLPCSCRPASFLQVLLHKVRPFPRALAQTLLLPSSSRPVSLSRIFIPRLHQGSRRRF